MSFECGSSMTSIIVEWPEPTVLVLDRGERVCTRPCWPFNGIDTMSASESGCRLTSESCPTLEKTCSTLGSTVRWRAFWLKTKKYKPPGSAALSIHPHATRNFFAPQGSSVGSQLGSQTRNFLKVPHNRDCLVCAIFNAKVLLVHFCCLYLCAPTKRDKVLKMF